MQGKLLRMLVAIGAAALLTAACTFVQVDPEAEVVEVVTADAVEDCERVGRTRVQVADSVLIFNRSDDAIREDLDKLARNSAAEMGGNAVYLDGEVIEGRATYQVYRCN